jgi:hypothetical protein
MAAAVETEPEVRFADKELIRRLLDEQDKALGFVPVPDASIAKLRAMMLADGIRPEDNAFSREIIEMRDE